MKFKNTNVVFGCSNIMLTSKENRVGRLFISTYLKEKNECRNTRDPCLSCFAQIKRLS